jgi:hypothetical protein
MNCVECEVLIRALINSELDAEHARDVEALTQSTDPAFTMKSG